MPPVAISIFGPGDQLPGLFDKEGRLRRVPSAITAGETISFEHAVAANSRVFRAGAHLLVRTDREAGAVGREGLATMRREETAFPVVRPIQLSSLPFDVDGDIDDLTAQPLPADVAAVDWSGAPNF